MKFFHDYDEPSRPFTAREHDLIARLLKAEAAETIRGRNGRLRDWPEERQGAMPVKYGEKCRKPEQPKVPRPSAKDARAREADRAVLEALSTGSAYIADLARRLDRSQWSVYEATMRLSRAGHVIYAMEKLVTERNAAYRKLWSITGKGRNAITAATAAGQETHDAVLRVEVPETAKAAVAPIPEGIDQGFLGKRYRMPGMPRAPWEREAAE